MSIRYDLYETPDIQQTGEQQPLHPRVVINGTVDQNEFLDRVHKFTGISRSLLSGAMQSFQNELRDLLANGWNVELVQFVQMLIPQHRYNEVWPEVMQDIMKAVTSGETIQRNGTVKNIPDQQVLVKQ